MNKNNFKIDIGIPSYNEGENIRKLILDILSQNLDNMSINSIIVSSDGSNDNTIDVLKKIKDTRFKNLIVIDNQDRKGIARGLNQIIQNATSDCLITLDADIKITNSKFISNLAGCILNEHYDHTSSAIKPKKQNTFFGKIIYSSMEIKNYLFDNWKQGNNIYTCHGLARGYSRRFYTKLMFPISIGNDMYSYLRCIELGYTFKYVKDSVAYYKLPTNFKDHKRQSLRFLNNSSFLTDYFELQFVKDETTIKCSKIINCIPEMIGLILKNNVYILSYVFIFLYINFFYKSERVDQAWQISGTTK